ncbi:L,D-transpeptidase family protein [Tahibacter sp.]|uniref:L,D-transpeptidase family protein n=1 Tax=Tahibacter sp. TaxID=2056211 RepID=UPI0028C40E46|nr:L,D-transpeptidase family protein [Tahibacter sp.]
MQNFPVEHHDDGFAWLQSTGAVRRLVRVVAALWMSWLPIVVFGMPCVADPESGPPHSCPRLPPLSSSTTLDAALDQFYELRSCRLAWADTVRLDRLIAGIRALEGDGLVPADYFLDRLERMRDRPASAAAPWDAESDALATRAYLLALAHLYYGKVVPRELYPDWNFEPRAANLADGLRVANSALDEGDIAAMFARARPSHPVYAVLREALGRLRAIAAVGGWPSIPAGPTLEPGARDPSVPALRHRLAVAGYGTDATEDPELYDPVLAQAVRDFQTEQYLDVDGRVGAATREALNVPVAARIDQVRVNLERARWQLPEIKDDFVLVDIAGYKVSYYEGATLKWMSRAQVGRPYRRTPSFRSVITHVTFNPTWTVPPTILRNDVLPKVRRDSAYLAAHRLRAFDAAGNPLDPAGIDWSRASGISLRQDAGADNSLGRVAIRFPNPYGVYLHDTPHTELFDRQQRAFSSGCIRVERPLELVELLLDDQSRWNRAALLQVTQSGVTQSVALPRPVAVLLMYWSIDLHDGKRTAYKRDVYHRDAAVLAALDRPTALWPGWAPAFCPF